MRRHGQAKLFRYEAVGPDRCCTSDGCAQAHLRPRRCVPWRERLSAWHPAGRGGRGRHTPLTLISAGGKGDARRLGALGLEAGRTTDEFPDSITPRPNTRPQKRLEGTRQRWRGRRGAGPARWRDKTDGDKDRARDRRGGQTVSRKGCAVPCWALREAGLRLVARWPRPGQGAAPAVATQHDLKETAAAPRPDCDLQPLQQQRRRRRLPKVPAVPGRSHVCTARPLQPDREQPWRCG